MCTLTTGQWRAALLQALAVDVVARRGDRRLVWGQLWMDTKGASAGRFRLLGRMVGVVVRAHAVLAAPVCQSVQLEADRRSAALTCVRDAGVALDRVAATTEAWDAFWSTHVIPGLVMMRRPMNLLLGFREYLEVVGLPNVVTENRSGEGVCSMLIDVPTRSGSSSRRTLWRLPRCPLPSRATGEWSAGDRHAQLLSGHRRSGGPSWHQSAASPTRIRGRSSRASYDHTPRARAVPGGALLIDTPGMRELQLWSAGAGVDEAFDDITVLGRGCRFANCTHEHEPQCAVKQAVAEGRLDAARLEHFRKLQKELSSLSVRQDVLAQEPKRRGTAASCARFASTCRPRESREHGPARAQSARASARVQLLVTCISTAWCPTWDSPSRLCWSAPASRSRFPPDRRAAVNRPSTPAAGMTRARWRGTWWTCSAQATGP